MDEGTAILGDLAVEVRRGKGLHSEMCDCLALTEKLSKIGPESPEAEAIEDKFAKELGTYFRALAGTVPATFSQDRAKRIAETMTEEANPKFVAVLIKYLEKGFRLGQDQAWELISDAVTESHRLQEAVTVNPNPIPNEVIDEYVMTETGKAIKRINVNTQSRIQQIILEGIEAGKGADAIGRDIRNKVRGWADTYKGRARTIARTELCNAMSEAQLQTYKRHGIKKKYWDTASGNCRICADNELDGHIPIDDAFSTGDMRPPAHPNAVFAESPVFAYGSFSQIVRSRYCGPARTIKTDRITFTIGPNHPILTRRGWVKASEIKEGDQLFYDARVENPAIFGMKSYFNQMPTIKDLFYSLMLSFGNSAIAGPRAYFHGDQIFTYSEVDVVLPTRNLLPIFDISGVEHIRQFGLMGAYPDGLTISSISSRLYSGDGVNVTSPSGMGLSGLVDTLFGGHILPSYFHCVTTIHVQDSYYSGWAYDASTSTGLYNCSGIIVKNCRCALGAGV